MWEGAMWGLSGHPLASTLQVTSFTQASVGRDQRLYDPSFLRSTHACCWFSQTVEKGPHF